MVTLKIHDIGWVKGPEDDPEDQCAHGRIELTVNQTSFVKPEDGYWTVSAAGLYLLRTLTLNNTWEDPVTDGNLLFPCCGFSVWPIENKFKVLISGCPNGIDAEVHHKDGNVILSSLRKKGILTDFPASETVPEAEWKQAILGFTEIIKLFYAASSPKKQIIDDYDRRGWEEFWREWEERVANAG